MKKKKSIINENIIKSTNKLSKSTIFLLVFLLISAGVIAETVIRNGASSDFPDGIDGGDANFTSINNVLYVQAGNGSDIQAKINQCPLQTGNTDECEVVIPPGTYTLTEAILINESKIRLKGSGYATKLNPTTPGQDTIIVGNYIAQTSYIEVNDLTIFGDSIHLGQPTATGTSIRFLNHKKGGIQNVLLYGGLNGLEVYSNLSNGATTLNKFINLEIGGMDSNALWIHNDYIGGGNFVTANQFTNFYFHDSPYMINLSSFDNATGSNSDELSHNQFVNGYVDNYDSNTSYRLFTLKNADDTKFTNVYFDGATSNLQGEIDNYSTGTMFIGSDIDGLVSDNGTRSIYVNDQSGIKFNSNGEEIFRIYSTTGNATFSNYTFFNTNSGASKTYFTRSGTTSESMNLYIGDDDAIFESVQDENSGASGGFNFIMDSGGSADPDFEIYKGGTKVAWFDSDGSLTIGSGSSQKNITLTSPDGTEYSCGVNNGGSFTCI